MIQIFHLMNYTSGYKYFTIDSETRITDVFEYWPAFRALPTEIKNVESTEEEFQAYVEKLAEALGADPSTVADYRLGGKSINGQSIVVIRHVIFRKIMNTLIQHRIILLITIIMMAAKWIRMNAIRSSTVLTASLQ